MKSENENRIIVPKTTRSVDRIDSPVTDLEAEEGQYVMYGGKVFERSEGIFIPTDIQHYVDQDAYETSMTSKEIEKTQEERITEGKIVEEKHGLYTVREPTRIEKAVELAKEIGRRLVSPKGLAYAAKAAVTVGGFGLGMDMIDTAEAYADTPTMKGSLEVMAGQESTTMDLKLIVPVEYDLGIFTRHRITPSYEDGSIGTFHLLNINYNIVDGLSVLAEVDAGSAIETHPRLGFQYGTKLGDVGLFSVAHIGITDNPDVTLIGNVVYHPELTDNLKLVADTEVISMLHDDGHKVSFFRPRLGVDYKGLEAGAACDFILKGNEPAFSYNCGGFLKVIR